MARIKLKSGITRALAFIAASAVLMIGLLHEPSRAQSSDTHPEFEVASIKALKTDLRDFHPQFNCSDRGRLVSSGVPVKYLIEWAYDIRNEFSVPDWAEEGGERYTVEAKAADGPVSPAQCKLMTQNFLQDRFKLNLHHETKEAAIYALVVGKGGSKLHEVTADTAGDGVWLRGRKVSAKGIELWMIAATLATTPGVERPVVDKTGLTGLFEFRLDYSVRPDDDRPDIFRAVQDQLGLKLETTKGPVEFVIIDHIEKPSEN